MQIKKMQHDIEEKQILSGFWNPNSLFAGNWCITASSRFCTCHGWYAGTHKAEESSSEPKTVSVIMNTPRGMHDKDILITVIVAHNCMVACKGAWSLGEGSGQCDVARRIYIYSVYCIYCSLKIKARWTLYLSLLLFCKEITIILQFP